MKADEKITLRMRLEDQLVRWLESPRFPLYFMLTIAGVGIAASGILIARLFA